MVSAEMPLFQVKLLLNILIEFYGFRKLFKYSGVLVFNLLAIRGLFEFTEAWNDRHLEMF